MGVQNLKNLNLYEDKYITMIMIYGRSMYLMYM